MRDETSPFASPTSLASLADDLKNAAEEITKFTTWHIRCGAGRESVFGLETQEAAIEAACRLMDGGIDVLGVGAGHEEISDRERLAATYAIWVRARY